MCCFCPWFVSLVEIPKASPTHQEILLWIAHLIYAIPQFIFPHPTHSSGAQGSNCRGNSGDMLWGMRGRATSKHKKKSWRIIIFKPTAWNVQNRHLRWKPGLQFSASSLGVKPTWFSCSELISLKSFRSSLTSSTTSTSFPVANRVE